MMLRYIKSQNYQALINDKFATTIIIKQCNNTCQIMNDDVSTPRPSTIFNRVSQFHASYLSQRLSSPFLLSPAPLSQSDYLLYCYFAICSTASSPMRPQQQPSDPVPAVPPIFPLLISPFIQLLFSLSAFISSVNSSIIYHRPQVVILISTAVSLHLSYHQPLWFQFPCCRAVRPILHPPLLSFASST